MASGRAADVQEALARAKRKISSLQQQVNGTSGTSGTSGTRAEEPSVSQCSSRELRDSLVDMYRGNPRVNVELRQRLPSPARHTLISCDRSDTRVSVELRERTQVSQDLQEPPGSPSPSPLSHRRSVSPVSPLSRRRSVSPVSPLSRRRSVSPVSPLYHRRSVSPVSPLLSSRPAGGVVEMEVDSLSESCDHDGSAAPRGCGSPAPRRHLVTDHSFPQDTSGDRPPTLDQDKNISFLLKELDALRNINQKLQEQLLQKEKELQRKEVEEELREEGGWERPTVMLEEALSAQRDRDQALMSRLLLANEERDEALLRARRLQQAAEVETSDLLDSHMDVDELLQCICDADSVQEVQQFGSVLVQRLQLTRQRRNDITAQEMKVVMGERDGSVAKCKRLEQDLIQEREQKATKDELLRFQRERDGALDDMRLLEAELQALRANCSVSSMDVLEAPPPQAPPPQAASMLVQLQQLSKEKESVEAELQRCQEAEQEASDRVRRLERLVEVLRKKVGTGSLRAVS